MIVITDDDTFIKACMTDVYIPLLRKYELPSMLVSIIDPKELAQLSVCLEQGLVSLEDYKSIIDMSIQERLEKLFK